MDQKEPVKITLRGMFRWIFGLFFIIILKIIAADTSFIEYDLCLLITYFNSFTNVINWKNQKSILLILCIEYIYILVYLYILVYNLKLIKRMISKTINKLIRLKLNDIYFSILASLLAQNINAKMVNGS